MTDQSPLPSDRRPAATRIVFVDPNAVRISALNPRAAAPITPESVANLAAEMRAAGQINDAHAEEAPDGVLELLAGLRRRVACLVNGTKLRVRIHSELSRQAAIMLAYRDDRGSLGLSFWDMSGGWAKLLADGTVETDAALAELLDVDTGTMSRGLALRNAPQPILAAFGDVRAISQRQWMDIAPLIEDEETLARLLERAALISGKGYVASRVAAELKAAAAGKTEIKPIEVRNRHGRIIATITPGHRGDFTIKVRSMREMHPTHRLEFAKLVNDRFVETLKTWFGNDG